MSQQARVQFEDAYTEAMADIAERLRLLVVQIERSRERKWAERRNAVTFQRDPFSLVGQVCRIVAETWAPGFGSQPYRPVSPEWPTAVALKRVFSAEPRLICPAKFETLTGEQETATLLPEKNIPPAVFQSTHRSAELLCRQQSSVSEEWPHLEELALEYHKRLFDCLSAHVVSLPEWGGSGFLRFVMTGVEGAAEWQFCEGLALVDSAPNGGGP